LEKLVVDGYNVIHAWPALKSLMHESLEAARDKLIDRLAVYAQVSGSEVTVVFDAHRTAAMNNAEEWNQGVRVLYTRKGHSADHAIERMAYSQQGDHDPLTVATSDRFQSNLVRGVGGAVISAQELERRVVEAEKELGRTVDKYAR
jgi:predicted RNA-binding protein with PIN domain